MSYPPTEEVLRERDIQDEQDRIMAERSPASEKDYQRDNQRDNALVEHASTESGPTIERAIRVNATANSKGVVQDSTVSVRIIVPLGVPAEVVRGMMDNELSELQTIANRHLKVRKEELQGEGYFG